MNEPNERCIECDGSGEIEDTEMGYIRECECCSGTGEM